MIDYSKIITEILKDRSLPEFVRRDYPMFEEFVSSYFEFLEQQKNPIDITNHLLDYRAIDRTLDEFLEHFRKEYLVNIPVDVLADKRLLVKHIRRFYLNKGNENSYKFLFRILYNESIDFYYPKVDILRASDGKWVEEKSIKLVVGENGQFKDLLAKRIRGQSSGALAIVESVIKYTDRSEHVVEIFISDVRGEFILGENIEVLDALGHNLFVEESYSVLKSVVVTDGGGGYSTGQVFPIYDSASNQIATGTILKVGAGPISGLSIVDGGIGYNGELNEIDVFENLPFNFEWNSTIVDDYAFDDIDSNGDFEDNVFEQIIPIETIPGIGDVVVVSDGLNSPGTGAFGIVSKTDTMGTITEVELISSGTQYESPSATVVSETGTGAIIDVDGGAGQIIEATLNSFPIFKPETDTDSDAQSLIYPDFSNLGNGLATGTITLGILVEYPGRYLNDDGHLSSTKKLQDNFYYQDYSYVIRVGKELSIWRDIVKKIIHPAGLMMFGETSIVSTVDVGMKAGAKCVSIEIVADSSPTMEMGYEESLIIGHVLLEGFENMDSNGFPTQLDWESWSYIHPPEYTLSPSLTQGNHSFMFETHGGSNYPISYLDGWTPGIDSNGYIPPTTQKFMNLDKILLDIYVESTSAGAEQDWIYFYVYDYSDPDMPYHTNLALDERRSNEIVGNVTTLELDVSDFDFVSGGAAPGFGWYSVDDTQHTIKFYIDNMRGVTKPL